jgi:hypothetical protein
MPKIKPTQLKITSSLDDGTILKTFFIEINYPFNFENFYKKLDIFVRNENLINQDVKIWFSKKKMKYNSNRSIKLKF